MPLAPRQTPRPYQTAAVNALRAAVARGVRRLLLVAPTGAGKTTVASVIIDGAAARGSRTWFVAHRAELIQQCSARLDQQAIPHGVVMAAHPRWQPERLVQVVSVQTVRARGALTLSIDVGAPSIVVVDECHLARAESYASLLATFPKAVVVGLTASPWRLDGKGLGALFEDVVVAATPAELERQGYLAAATGFCYDKPDLTGVHKRGGEFAEDELAPVMSTAAIAGNVVQRWIDCAEGRWTLGFAVNVAHSEMMRDAFLGRGIPAEHVDGTTPAEERAAILGRLASGETRVLWNCQILTMGYDLPRLETIILARPTASLALQLQMVGRGSRPACRTCGSDVLTSAAACRCGSTDIKKRYRIHDHAGNILLHGLPNAEQDYALTADVQRQRPKGEQAAALTTCPACYAIFLSTPDRCPACGRAHVRKVREVEVVDGVEMSLEEAAAARRHRRYAGNTSLRNTYEMLRDEGIKKGHGPRWASVQYHIKTKLWPPKEWMSPKGD